MIARKNRFHGYNALRFVYRQGKTARGPLCMLKYVPNSRNTGCRAAVVVAKKVHKSAVIRNRIRRRIYAQLESRIGDWPAYDLVFTVTDGQIAKISEKDIKNIIERLLQIATIVRQPVDK